MDGFVQFFTKILQVGFTRITSSRVIRINDDGEREEEKEREKKIKSPGCRVIMKKDATFSEA